MAQLVVALSSPSWRAAVSGEIRSDAVQSRRQPVLSLLTAAHPAAVGVVPPPHRQHHPVLAVVVSDGGGVQSPLAVRRRPQGSSLPEAVDCRHLCSGL